jgi:ATP-dependent helicase HrpB
MSKLPIEDVLPALCHTLTEGRNALLTAAPGAGKTTRVPLALLDAPWLVGKALLMLEPRRLAARAAAHRMASTLGEPVGGTVGYRMRLDTKVGPKTRIEVVTEGILARLLQQDPALSNYAIVLFDEFHERSIQADTGLALCLESQRLFRPDLRLLVMSATLDCGPVSELMGQAPVIVCEGRLFPVETRYLEYPLSGRLDAAVVQSIRCSLTQDEGSLLVFLPGRAEIRRVERALLALHLGSDILIAPLHGDLPQEAQDRAIAPAQAGMRKIVLATSIAETSVTIDGVRVVIDAGLLRVPRFDPRSGLTRLETIRVTQDSAEQRRGRAGRLEPGICSRLWTFAEHRALAPRRPPEMLDADLAPLLLELILWGTANPAELSWLTPPPAGALAQAKELLTGLGALTADGQITVHGKQMAELPLHPRLAHMLLKSVPLQLTGLACELAALLSERDIVQDASGRRHADLRLRVDVLHRAHDHPADVSIDRAGCERVRRSADLWERRFPQSVRPNRPDSLDEVGLLLALAYPDRIAQRLSGSSARYLMANGRGAIFANPDPLESEDYLVIADLDGGTQWARIDRAAPVRLRDLETLYEDRIEVMDEVLWDDPSRMVRAKRQRRLGSLVISEQGLSNPDPSMIVAALLQGIRHAGLDTLSWTPELRQWRARVEFLRRITGQKSQWPDLSDDALLRTLPHWLGPYLAGLTTLDRVTRLDLTQPLHALLSWEQQRQLGRWAPTHVTVPSGSTIRVEYETPDVPILAVRLQEMFGCKDTPRLIDGTIPVMLHLLSPARRPVQVTTDLSSFWTSAYHEIKKELRGRYPKHSWPDDPLTALPTAKATRRSR